ncbi:MAG TPA: SEC-C metal-binding domain-containing protein [Spirochaetia bacterium]|nr:SEC-C metal-binding domain-containing protein [Spirochaetia bacterium]
MSDWSREFQKGKRFLARHRPEAALACFDRALRDVHASPSAAAEATYYRGLALFKLRSPGRALASWVQSQRYRKSRHPRQMLERCSNAYGMPKRENGNQDDRHAFFSVQLSRYLQRKTSRSLDTRAESDMINELIEDHWQALLGSGVLEGKSSDEKSQLFRGIIIVFPYFSVPDRLDDRLVHVDFEAKRRISPGDRCPCRSGLSFKQCCGRIPAEDELFGGGF